MRVIHENPLTRSDPKNSVDATRVATTSWTSPVYDLYSIWTVAWTLKFAGTSGASITLTMEGSNQVPPPNFVSDEAWAPAADSWEQVYSGGIAITLTVTADGVYTLAADISGLMFRWNRLVMTVNTPGGGTFLPAIFAKGSA